MKKREEKNRQEQEAKLNRHREDVKKLTEKEKEERLRAMEHDASMHDESRFKRLSSEKIPSIEDQNRVSVVGDQVDATFLKEMRTEVYSTGVTSVVDRLNQNRHYVQKGRALESNFMQR